ncbi:YfhO family protein [Roseiflexus sp.]
MFLRLFERRVATSPRAQHLLVAVGLALIIVLFYWHPIFKGKALVPTDLLFIYSAFRKAAPEGFTGPSNPEITDPVFKFYPWQIVMREALSERQFPLWNPYQFCGTPLLANGESAILYPMTILGLLLPVPQAWNLSILLRIFIAGFGMYLFTRSIGISSFGSAFAALVIAFSGSMTVWLNYPIGYVYAWMPLQMYFCERLVQQNRLSDTVIGGGIIAVHFFGGHIQTSFMILLVWISYGVFRVVIDYSASRDIRRALSNLILLVLACIIGVLLASVMLVPFGEWLLQGSELRRRVESRSISLIDPNLGWNILFLVTIILPNALGNPTWGSGDNFVPTSFIEQTAYIGLTPLALALFVIKSVYHKSDGESSSYRSKIIFFVFMGIIALGLAIRLPPFDLINHMPVFNVVAYQRYRLIFTFCAVVLAGYGMDAFIKSGVQDQCRFARKILIFVLFAAFGLLFVLAVLIVFRESLMAFNRVKAQYELMIRAYSPGNLAMYAPLLTTGIFSINLMFIRRVQKSVHLRLFLIFIASFVDLALFGAKINPEISPEHIYPMTPVINAIRQGLDGRSYDRIVGLYDTMPGNTGTPYGLYDITGTDFPLEHYTEVALLAGATRPSSFRLAFPRVEFRMASMLGVRYIVAFDWPEGWRHDQLRLVYRDEHALIYENLKALPRAYLVGRATVATDNEAIAILGDPDFDPALEIVVDRSLPVALTGNPSLSGDAKIVSYSSNRVVIQAIVEQDSMLFLSDAYYPGWRATVNGQETSIYRANLAFRAVYLPAGEHRVEFIYDPLTFKIGLGMTLTGFVLAVIFLVGERWRRSMNSSAAANVS